MNTQPFTGGCLCGSIRYEASGTPYHVTHCHCLDCRRSSGAAFVTWASFQRQELRFIAGQPRELNWAGRLRSFCPQCGTPLTFLMRADADEIDVTVCTLDNPTLVKPEDNIWVEDRIAWVSQAESLPAYPQRRPKHG
jgi:hypothetical protein